MVTRRRFLRTAGVAALALGGGTRARAEIEPRLPRGRPSFPDPAHGWRGASSSATLPLRLAPQSLAPGPLPPLSGRFPDLARHFVFEYYPWYSDSPVRHWDQWERLPPAELASNYVPLLGAYDSRAAATLERHARWIAESGAGAINLSWWGPGSFEDRLTPLVMDVMAAHDLKVAFHLEPYASDHGPRFSEDVLYLLERYGARRRWDAMLLLRDEGGAAAPVFKAFRAILPEFVTDCHGVRQRVPDHTPDAEWRRQTDRLRRTLAADFDRVTLLADSLDMGRTASAGFDGIAIYDPFVTPGYYRPAAEEASRHGLVFSFAVNPGYDAIEPRTIEPGACYAPTPFEPPFPGLDWSDAADRERAAELAAGRIAECLSTSLRVQRDARLRNVERGFFLVYLTSFNEWHEGHAFEPMKDAGQLSESERSLGYHNPEEGGYRLSVLSSRLRSLLQPAAEPLRG
jgi:hypothetical protein